MSEKFAEADLLALIEGELKPERAADLRRRLAGDRKLLALVERLQDDREMLRTMEQPRLPADLLSELEPMMARPMLMPDSGDWRRRYGTRRPWRRYLAVAAVVCMALLAGVWAVTSGVLDAGGMTAGSMLAMQDAQAPTTEMAVAETAARPDETGPWPPAGSTLHHRRPLDAAVAADTASPRQRRQRGAPPSMTTVEFVLVVDGGDGGQEAVQDTLRRVLGGLDGDVALVRNFSFREAERLARRIEAQEGRRLDRELARAREDFAGIGGVTDRGNGGDRLVRRRKAASRLARTFEQSGDGLSGQLMGPRSLAPTYEQQLEYAEGGATWTITVPAALLNEVLAGLQIDEGRETVLRARRDDAPATLTVDRWLTDYPRILREASALDGNVMLPVRIAD